MSPGSVLRRLALLLLFLASATAASAQAVVDPELKGVFSGLATDGTAEVVVTFHGSSAPDAADLDALRSAGIAGGRTFRALPIAGVLATWAQVEALAQSPRVRSLFWNKQLDYYNYDARQLTGVDRLRTDAAITKLNRGLPVSGKGVAIVINDSGVDGTHPDLKLGKNLVQNVQAPLGREDLAIAAFEPIVVLEDQPNTDLGSGHGTHVAGTVGGTGQASSGKHAGMATGADLIGFGSGGVLFILNALGGFDWSLANQGHYGIRVITNSWGSSGGFNPDNPINVASRIAHSRNIVVTFAAGNSGSAPDTHNPYAKAPWVISVAAGEKNGTLADFSSRGTPGGAKTVRSATGEVITWLDEPAVTAPGVDIVSAYAHTGVLGALDPDGNPYYTVMSGTSMATPVVAGIVGLMLEANPLLTPDEVKQALQETATKMPDALPSKPYRTFETGAGYVNAYAAVQKAFDIGTPFGATLRVDGTLGRVEASSLYDETFDYTPGMPPGTYKHAFTVASGTDRIEAEISYDGVSAPLYGDAGNGITLDVYDPDGNRYYAYDLLFAVYGTKRLVVAVNNPKPGQWTAEVKHFTLLGTQGNLIGSLPDRVHEKITAFFFDPPAINDIQGHPAQKAIEFTLANGFLELCSKSSFCPNKEIRRAELARGFTQFGAVRQFLPLNGGSTFADVSAEEKPFVEAVAATGAALRDPQFRYGGVMEGNGTSFDPNGKILRAELAKMLVRGVGGDYAALGHSGDVTVILDDDIYVIADQDQIPAALRGYVHAAINSNMMNVFWRIEQGPYDLQPTLKAYFEPGSTVSRADAAVAVSRYHTQFFKR